jgi:hypothetical protein
VRLKPAIITTAIMVAGAAVAFGMFWATENLDRNLPIYVAVMTVLTVVWKAVYDRIEEDA